MMGSKKLIAIGAGCLCASGVSHAEQTASYTYDALGRLVQAQTLTGPGSGTVRTYQYDAAGNRTQRLISGAAGLSAVTLSMPSAVVNVTSAGAPLTISISASSASGTVTFTENGTFLGSTWVISGQASVLLEGLPKGVHSIIASYSGDGTHAAQTTTFTVRVQNLSWLPAVLELLLSN